MKRVLSILTLLMLQFQLTSVYAEDKALSNKIEKLEKDLISLQHNVYNDTKARSSNIGAVNSAKIDDTRNQIKQLASLIEQLQFEVSGITERMVKLSNDVEFKINDINSKITDSIQAQTTLDSIDEQLDDDFLKNNGSDAAALYKKNLKQADINPELEKLTPEQQYQSAYSYLKKQEFNKALETFEYFLSHNSKHALVSNAYYWIGEIFFRNHNFERSAVEYLRGYQTDTQGTRAADNLLKLGISLSSLERKKEACISLHKLKKEFSHMSSNIRNRMEQELDKLNCVTG